MSQTMALAIFINFLITNYITHHFVVMASSSRNTLIINASRESDKDKENQVTTVRPYNRTVMNCNLVGGNLPA